MANDQSSADVTHNQCSRCGSDLVSTVGGKRIAVFGGIVARVPERMPLTRCHSCGSDYPTPEQAAELRDVAERDSLGDGGRGYRPVVRGT